MTTHTQHNLADHLQRERERLALDVADGKPGAAAELDRVEAQIAARARDTERAALAERERQRRDAEQQAEAERQRIAALESHARALTVEQLAAARAVDAALDVLAERLATLMAVGADVYATRRAIRPSAALHRLPGLVLASLQWRLSPMLPDIGRPLQHGLRKPLTELLAGSTPPEA